MSPFFLRGGLPRSVLRHKLCVTVVYLPISGLSLASFIACFAEGGGSISGKRRWLTRMQLHRKEGIGDVKVLKDWGRYADLRNVI